MPIIPNIKVEPKTEEDLQKEAQLKEVKETRRKEKLEKQAKLNEPKPKYYYDVKLECMLPATLTYRILAETPEQAAELIRGQQPNAVHHKLLGRKELMLRVYDSGSSMMRFMRKLFG